MEGNTCHRSSVSLDLKTLLKQQKDEGVFCDAVLRVGHGLVRAHRCVLAAASSYFQVLFTGPFLEKHQEEIDLSQTFASLETFEAVVNAIYGEPLYVTAVNVAHMLEIADKLSISVITRLCTQYLVETLQLKNCFWTWTLAEVYQLQELAYLCEMLAVQWFHHYLIGTDDALRVPPHVMVKFFERGLTQYCSKDQLEKFIDRYTQQNNEMSTYKSKLTGIAGKVEKHVDKNMSDLLRCWCSKIEPNDSSHLERPCVNSATHASKNLASSQNTTEEIILGTGSINNTVVAYNTSTDKWHHLTYGKLFEMGPEERPSYIFGIGKLGEYILKFSDTHQAHLVFNVTTKVFKKLPAVPEMLDGEIKSGGFNCLYPFCIQGNLYIVYLFPKVSGDYDALVVPTALYVLHFNLNTWSWKPVGYLFNVQGIDIECRFVYHENGSDVYILILNRDMLYMSCFHALSRKINNFGGIRTATMPMENFGGEVLRMSCAGGSSDKIYALTGYGSAPAHMGMMFKVEHSVRFFSSGCSFPAFQLATVNWNLSKSHPKIRFAAISHRNAKAYYFVKAKLGHLVRFLSVDMEGNQCLLRPPPYYWFMSKVQLVRMSKSTLDKLIDTSYVLVDDLPVCPRLYAEDVLRGWDVWTGQPKQESRKAGTPATHGVPKIDADDDNKFQDWDPDSNSKHRETEDDLDACMVNNMFYDG